MRLIFSEYQADYAAYTFAYAVYCLQEHDHETPDIYARGFLPYSGDITRPQNLYYLARSVRVDLAHFSDTSENRRIDRKAASLGINLTVADMAAVERERPAFVAFCTQYADARFCGGTMNAARLRYVLTRQAASHLLTFSAGDAVLGYVVACITAEMLHYWYAFFDVAYLRSHALGKWMMWRVIGWAKDQELRYAYLGTCYGQKALYKVRDHRGCEFFDGCGWNRDLEALKTLCQRDDVTAPRNEDRPCL
jgi:leucyl-tRNA---protein transferase